MATKHILVLVRHGESQWNKENRFTGWVDVDLSEKGLLEAQKAGQELKKIGLNFDLAYTSVLKRAIRTLWIVLDQTNQMWIPVIRSWRLNERHYGALQGLNKKETTDKFGEEQVFTWRRSYDIPPPSVKTDDPNHPSQDSRYKNVDSKLLPAAEALKQCKDRVMPLWESEISPLIRKGKTVLIVAHGNSLRALIKHLENISDQDIADLNLPTGIPLVYELDENLKPVNKKYLGDPEEIAKATHAVANQAKLK